MSEAIRDLIPEQAWAILISEPSTAEYMRAAELIVATDLERLAHKLRASLHVLPEYTHGSLAWRVMNEIDERAAELRGVRKVGAR